MRIGLVSCGKEKLTSAAPARDMYQGDLFKKARRYAEANYDKWFILSAKYGLLDPDQVIEPYDKTLNGMKKKERAAWTMDVVEQLAAVTDKEKDLFFLHAGRNYRDIRFFLKNWSIPLMGLGIGQQKAWYKKQGF